MTWLNDLSRDLRHALRVLGKNRKFTAVVVFTLALGIGASTAIFTVVNSVLLSPLRYPDPDRIVSVVTKWKSTGRITPRLTGGDLLDIREQAGIFSAFSSYFGGEVGVQVAGRGDFAGAFWVIPVSFRLRRDAVLWARLRGFRSATVGYGRPGVRPTKFRRRRRGARQVHRRR